MAKYDPIRNIVENLLVCTDEQFKEFLVPYVNEALEDHTDDRYLSWGYDDDDTPLERLREYWGDMADEEDPDVKINEEECKTVRECKHNDLEKIRQFLNSEAINIEKFKIDHNIWFYQSFNVTATELIQKYVDTTLNIKMLEDDINALLISSRFEHYISQIDSSKLIEILKSRFHVHDYEYCITEYVMIDGHRHFFGRDEEKCVMNELAKRLGDDTNE